MKGYLWCEDKESGQIFWERLCAEFYPDIIVDHPRVYAGDHEVWGNRHMLRMIDEIDESDGNVYYILPDMAEVYDVRALGLSIYDQFVRICENKKNVFLIKGYICFESIFINFNEFESWLSHQKTITNPILLQCIRAIRNYINSPEEEGNEYRDALRKFRVETIGEPFYNGKILQ